MKLTRFSQQRLQATFGQWNVPDDYAGPITNYLLYGLHPGNCFAALVANDAIRAIQSCHPANTIDSLKRLTGWMAAHLPASAGGSWAAIKYWHKLSDAARRSALEEAKLIYSEEEEIMLALRDLT